MKARKYTGTADGVATGRRAGMVAFIDEIQQRSGGALWNNGDFLVRDVKGKAGQMSVHSTGRAVDLSYRFMRSSGKGSATRGIPNGGRKEAIRWCRLLVRNADLLGIECVLDYFPLPYGRGWRCNRRAWIRYDVKTISGGGGGDWLHVELSPAVADDAAAMRRAFTQLMPLDN